jgi:dihydroorotate dehydrogenase (NAD+) catalytic subunit
VDLAVSLGSLRLKNPVMTASGTYGYGHDVQPPALMEKLGALCTKGLSLKPRDGNPPPRIWETECGMLNAIGLANMGIEKFLGSVLPDLAGAGVTVIANIYGESEGDFEALAGMLRGVSGIAAVELNVSCPNVKLGGMLFGMDPGLTARLTAGVVERSGLPVIVKLTPQAGDLVAVARAAQDAGASAVTAVNTFKAMAVDSETARPRLSTVFGGLSGPAIRPIVMRIVYELYGALSIPIIASGGIMTSRDAVEYLMAGATAVQVGMASFLRPQDPFDVLSLQPSRQHDLVASLSPVHVPDPEGIANGLDAPAADQRNGVSAAHDDGTDVERDGVGEPLFNERGDDLAAPLDEDGGDRQAPELSDQVLQIDSPVGDRAVNGLNAVLLELFLLLVGAAGDEGGDLGRRLNKPAVDRGPKMRVGHDPPGRSALPGYVPDREQGIVPDHRVQAHQDGVVLGPQAVHLLPGGLRRDPAGVPGGRGDPSVQAHGGLDPDEGDALRDEKGPFLDELPAPGLQGSLLDDHVNARGFQRLHAPAVLGGVRVEGPHVGPPDSGGRDGVRAGRRPAPGMARLQRDDELRSGGPVPGRPDRRRLGVVLPGPEVKALGNDLAALDQNRSDPRIRARARGRGQGKGAPEELLFELLVQDSGPLGGLLSRRSFRGNDVRKLLHELVDVPE